MRAAVLTNSHGPEYGIFADPVPSDGSILVEVSAAAINPIDLILAKAHTEIAGFTPIVPGREGIGRVGGRRVYFSAAGNPFGSMGELSLATEDRLVDIPPGISDGDALSMGIAGLTAWLSLSRGAVLEKGEHVVILGASGVVGLLAVQAARLMGAGHIVAAARSREGLERARDAGADELIVLDDALASAAEFKDAARGRIDVILDPIWGKHAIAALQAASPKARMVQIGSSAGQDYTFNPAFMRMSEKQIIGFSSSVVSPAERSVLFKALCEHRLAGRMSIDVLEFPLADVGSAWKRQAASPHAKLVLTLGLAP